MLRAAPGILPQILSTSGFLITLFSRNLLSNETARWFLLNFGYFSEEIQLLKSQLHESKSLCQAAEVERDRLLELVTLLQKR